MLSSGCWPLHFEKMSRLLTTSRVLCGIMDAGATHLYLPYAFSSAYEYTLRIISGHWSSCSLEIKTGHSISNPQPSTILPLTSKTAYVPRHCGWASEAIDSADRSLCRERWGVTWVLEFSGSVMRVTSSTVEKDPGSRLKLLVLQLQQFFWDASRLKPWSESFLLLLNLDPFIEFEVGHFRTRRITLSVRGRAHKDSWRAPCWVLETARLQTIYVLSVQFRGSMTRQSCFKDLSKHGILGSVTET